MLPLPSAEWYTAHPKPVTPQNNYDIPLFRQGLRVPETDYEMLVDELTTAVNHNSIPFDNPTFNLRTSETRESISPVFQTLINKYSAKFGWDKIHDNIVRNYLFEFFKRWLYNKKRSFPRTKRTLSGSSVPVTPTGPSNQRSNLGSPSQYSQEPTTPSASNFFLSPLDRNKGRVQPLQSCTLFVTRTDDGRNYEDTIDVFMKPAARNLSTSHGPNDYEFSIFRIAITEELSYDEQADVIHYTHSQRGLLEVDTDSKWRVALRDLASQPNSGVLNFEIAQRDRHRGLRGLRDLRTANVDAQPTASPLARSLMTPSPSTTQQDTAQAIGPPSAPLTSVLPKGATQTMDDPADNFSQGKHLLYTPSGWPKAATQAAGFQVESGLSSAPSTNVLPKVATQTMDDPADNSSQGKHLLYTPSGWPKAATQAAGSQLENAVFISSGSNSPLEKLAASDFPSTASGSDTQEAVAQTPVSLRDSPSTVSSLLGKHRSKPRQPPNPQLPPKRYASSPWSAPTPRNRTVGLSGPSTPTSSPWSILRTRNRTVGLSDPSTSAQDDNNDSNIDSPLKRRKVSKSFSNEGGKAKSKNNDEPASTDEDTDSDVPLTRRKILERPGNDSCKAKSKNDDDLTDDDGDHIIYDNPSGNEAEEILPMQELTEEEHEKL
jgi:hypothetical protein